MERVVKINQQNQEQIFRFFSFCKENGISNSFSFLQQETEQVTFEKQEVFCLEKEGKIEEACIIDIEYDLKKAQLQILTKKIASKEKNLIALLEGCLSKLFTVDEMEEVFIKTKNDFLFLFDFVEYDCIPMGLDKRGDYWYSIERERVKEEAKQRI